MEMCKYYVPRAGAPYPPYPWLTTVETGATTFGAYPEIISSLLSDLKMD